MPLLTKSKHEQFAQAIASGQLASQAYQVIYGPAKGAEQSASRLMKHPGISARIGELQAAVSQRLLERTILDRQSRLAALETRWKLLNRVIEERGETYGKMSFEGYAPRAKDGTTEAGEGNVPPADVEFIPAPGAGTGLLCLDWRGKDAVQAVWKVDTGTLAELRQIEEQAARELGEWNPEASAALQIPVQVNVTFVSPANG